MLHKHFSRTEFECPDGCGFDPVDKELLWVLIDLRQSFGRPITINSGCRCPKHNAAVGGGTKSQHLLGKAADIVIRGVAPELVSNYLEERYPDKYGIGRYETFTHIDVREMKARW
ncbi:MAG: DUF882 domain-containing protein [Planctomycetes bacterium]|nr:DUF882 domain-containing protein [Planctomycetota bacterium]